MPAHTQSAWDEVCRSQPAHKQHTTSAHAWAERAVLVGGLLCMSRAEPNLLGRERELGC